MAMVMITDPDRDIYPSEEIIAQAFGLTQAEARLAARLATGQSLERIATELGISEGTVRNQLKAVFQKTETHRQGELIALLLRTFRQ